MVERGTSLKPALGFSLGLRIQTTWPISSFVSKLEFPPRKKSGKRGRHNKQHKEVKKQSTTWASVSSSTLGSPLPPTQPTGLPTPPDRPRPYLALASGLHFGSESEARLTPSNPCRAVIGPPRGSACDRCDRKGRRNGSELVFCDIP